MMFQKAALHCLFALALAVPSVPAQDNASAKTSAAEDQPLRVPKEKIPAAPPLSPADALKTFKLQPGFRIELVASEPMVEDPIVVQFDADGRMWVVEMRGYMPDVDGKGEQEPIGRVSVLEDVDGDGRMDKRSTFLDGLVMPRALAVVRDGALIAEPPHLWFCRDTNADGKCDDKMEVANDYGSQRAPEHTANGLVLARDNWIYSLYHTYRYRFVDGKWTRERMPNHVQWGLAQDDFGRLFYSSNGDMLRGNLIPSHYIAKAGPATRLNGVGAKIVSDQSVWPIRVNPGVNRGYLPKILREDGSLANVTAACGTCIYRGDNFPADCYGNAFVCEPAANVVKRNVMAEQDGVVTAKNAYDKAEFLASTDERFRPVNAYTGPDGALYIVDMYHGILQHRIYVTPYLRNQILDRGLERPLHQGRIYRVVYDKGPLNKKTQVAKGSSTELLKALSHANGWWRDTAQRLLVERNDSSIAPALQKLAAENSNPLARLHALWTLEGMAKLDAANVTKLLDNKDAKVRAAAVRVSESLLRSPSASSEMTALRAKVLSLAQDTSADVQIQLALSLGEIAPDDASKAALTNLAESKFALAKDAAKFGLGEREVVRPIARRTRVAPLSAEDQKRFEAGKAMYEAICIACHQPHGLGQEGLAPPLVESEWVSGSEQRLARIVLHGLRGPVTVKGQKYEQDMPALGVLEDDQVANILTYIRREWGHQFPPVSIETVKKIREENAKREDSWTEAELLKIP